MSTFLLRENEIQISPERELYNTIRQKYQTLAEKAAQQFSDCYAVNFKNIDDVHEKCTAITMDLLHPVIEEAIKDLIIQEIYDIDITEFEEYFSDFFTWDKDFATIDEKYLSIVLKAEELDAYRAQRREGRGQWVGGGFGISGAVKGAMQAGAMNLATGAVHGTFNLLAKGVSAVGDAIKKSALYDDPTTKTHLTNAVNKLIFNTHFALIAAINTEKPNSINGYVVDEDANKARRLIENVIKKRIPNEVVESTLLEAFILNPYNEDFYSYWIKAFGDKYEELEAIESHFGIGVSSKIKKDLISARKASLNLSTPEACEISLIDLEKYANSIGYRGFAKEKLELLTHKRQLDQERRTVQGIVYGTTAQAEAALDQLSRTVKGVVYASHAEANSERAKKSVGVVFGFAIFAVPFIAAFFTLRAGYSKQARLIAFAWVACIAGVMAFSPEQPRKVSNAATAPIIDNASFQTATPVTTATPTVAVIEENQKIDTELAKESPIQIEAGKVTALLENEQNLANFYLAANQQQEQIGGTAASIQQNTSCLNVVGCVEFMLSAARIENIALAMDAAKNIDLLQKPQRGDRKLARKLNAEALDALKDKNYELAASTFMSARLADGLDEEIVANLVFTYSAAKAYAQSEKTAYEGILINPRRANLWLPIAVAKQKQGKSKEALQAMWLSWQFTENKQRLLELIEKRSIEDDDDDLKVMFADSKNWFINNKKPVF
ncbi:hypothetical protein [Polaromonas sp. CG9_12]|nr:hypothetical protein [Polaromonas sp. CG9_12]